MGRGGGDALSASIGVTHKEFLPPLLFLKKKSVVAASGYLLEESLDKVKYVQITE